MMCRKHGKHEDDGTGAAGNTGIILLLTCIQGCQMLRMQHAIFRTVSGSGRLNAYLLWRRYSVLQDQEACNKITSVHA